MAQFGQMERVELNNGAAPVVQLKWLAQNNNKAHRIGAIVTQGGEPLTLGGNCSGTAILADGSTVPLTGAVSGNEAYVELNSTCYTVEGTIIVSVTWISGQLQTTLLWAVGTVKITNTGTVIQPGDPIPNLEQLMAQITAMQEATAAANAAASKSVRYDTVQSLTGAQKAQARQNIQAAQVTSVDFSGSDSGLYIEY
jgi:hypothetical protein